MRIKSPLSSAAEVRPLIAAGADEFYLGYVNAKLNGGGAGCLMNRRSNADANICSREELRLTVALAHDGGRPVFVTFNEHSYAESQRRTVLYLLDDAVAAGADGVIVADPGLMLLIRNNALPLKVTCGVGGGAFNSAAVRFFAALGAFRVVLPREMRTEEIKALSDSERSVEYEVLIMNTRCHFIDSCCNLYHPSPSARFFCRSISLLEPQMPDGGPAGSRLLDLHLREYRHWNKFCPESKHAGKEHCGVCALPELKAAGIAGLKIAGRALPTEQKIRCVTLLRECRDMLSSAADAADYRKRARTRVGSLCGQPYMCYYPDIH